MWNWLGASWGAVALWLTELPFALQFALVMVVVLPACLGAAWLIDRAVDAVSAWFGRSRDGAPPAGHGECGSGS